VSGDLSPARWRGTGRRRAPRPHRWRRALQVLGASVALVLVLASATAYLAYRHFDGNIASEDVTARLGTDRPERLPRNAAEQQPQNILLIGSDTREGAGDAKYGRSVTGARSDTTILLHLSADRERATFVSIPRDSWVDIPACQRDDGSMSAPMTERFNLAYSEGGSACTIKTVEKLTNVYVDHHVVVDFSGFKRMVNALGGVEVCLEEPVYDKLSKLDLPAGRQTVKGEQALAYVRVRYIGDGSDISRISRQQTFLSSMIQRAKSTQLLLNPVRLYSFLDAATQSLTTDPGLNSLNTLRKLAQSVQGIEPANVRFVTVPNQTNPADPNTVVWTEQADRLFAAIKRDEQWPPPRRRALTVAPDKVQVRVLDASSTPGLAAQAAADLAAAGFSILETTTAQTAQARTVVRYSPGTDVHARTLAAAVTGSGRQAWLGLGHVVELVVGDDYGGVDPEQLPRQSRDEVQTRSAAADVCA